MQPTAQTDSQSTPSPDLQSLQAWLSGSFSSAQQAIDDPSYFEIHLRAVPIWTDRTDARWLYIEQATATALDRPYRQRVYRLSYADDGAFVSTVYTLPGNPLDFAGAWREPQRFADIDPDDLTLRDGCDIVLTWDASEQQFVGSTVDDNCPSSLQGAAYATSEVVLTANELRSWDRGFDASGEQVWGAVAGPYIFVRMDTPAE